MGSVIPYLMGGLGNWLFQVAVAMFFDENATISEKYCARSPHTNTDYFKTILKHCPKGTPDNIIYLKEPDDMSCLNIEHTRRQIDGKNVAFYGYFQSWKYITEKFVGLLDYKNPALLEKYPNIGETCFLHVRGGDYVGHPMHDVGLSARYYTSCINFMKERGITRFTVFTNDTEYCNRQRFLDEIRYTIVEENELDTLYLMTQCKAGITANSTFSWWGAYLNRDRPLCLPSKWFNDPSKHIEGYFFPGCYIHQV